MRVLAIASLACLLLLPGAGAADPAQPFGEAEAAHAELDRVRVGAAPHWSPEQFHERVAVGVGWFVPQRWYDADGQLLTERSLLHPGRDIERTGLYLAVRF